MSEYAKTCLVVMPFGKKPVGRRNLPFLPVSRSRVVDFDWIYDRVVLPAIEAVELPEGGRLVARRADKGFYSSGIIGAAMFRSLEYARVVLADISNVPPNVVHELGTRHRARESGTIVLRQGDAHTPVDMNQARAFPYEYEPVESREASIQLVSRVLSESVSELRLDSSVQVAISRQQAYGQRYPGLEALLIGAEDDLRAGHPAAAAVKYEQATRRFDAGPLVRMKLAMMLREQSAWAAVVREANAVLADMPDYAEAHRERGIAENKLWIAAGSPAGMATGERSLLSAIALRPGDYDAHASLGGELKRSGRLGYAWEAYRRATHWSHGHPYPLLNKVKLEAHLQQQLVVDERRQLQLGRAERMRTAQVNDKPPSDAPWCFFDLAEMRLYAGEKRNALRWMNAGIHACSARWQAETCRQSLLLLQDVSGVDDALLSRMVRALQHAEELLPA
jgi:hypothetical protein